MLHKLKFQVKMISTLFNFSSILLFVFMIMNATQKWKNQPGMKSFRPEIHLNLQDMHNAPVMPKIAST